MGVEWIDLAQDKTKCRDPVNVVTNLRDPQNSGNLMYEKL